MEKENLMNDMIQLQETLKREVERKNVLKLELDERIEHHRNLKALYELEAKGNLY
jgi:hypothetical protein